jgi:hypothetical protein
MNPDEPLYSVIEFILNRATSEELEVIAEAVKRRREPGKGLGSISPRGMAENMAAEVKEQLGGMLDVRNISRQIITDLIRQKEPNIGDRDLEVLLDTWLPGTAATRTDSAPQAEPREAQPGERMAPDVLITLISQYIAARQGTLTREERDKLPKNWQTRYWDAFSDPIRGRIREHLSGRLPEVEFWNAIISTLDR